MKEYGKASPSGTQRNAGIGGWLLAALLLVWSFASGLLSRVVVPAAAPALPEKTGRAADRIQIARHLDWGTLLAVCAFAVGIAGGVGFVFLYWTGGGNLLLGGTLAIFFGGFGVALVLYARWLMPRSVVIGPRETLPSSPAAREELLEDFCAGAHNVHRRTLLKWMAAAGTGVFAAMIVSLMRSLGASPSPALFTTIWKRDQRLLTSEGKPITVDSLEPGSTVTVFPEDSLGVVNAQTVLIRVKEQLLQLPGERADWAPAGYVAYSRVCTHAGCPVGLYESETHLLLCPCHQSTFDVLRGATPTGGPAARALPQLPLYADSDGNLRAAGGFTEPPGPGFWGMP